MIWFKRFIIQVVIDFWILLVKAFGELVYQSKLGRQFRQATIFL